MYYGKNRKNRNKNLIIIEYMSYHYFCPTWWDMRKNFFKKKLSKKVHDCYHSI